MGISWSRWGDAGVSGVRDRDVHAAATAGRRQVEATVGPPCRSVVGVEDMPKHTGSCEALLEGPPLRMLPDCPVYP